MPFATRSMTDEAGNFGLMHRKYHGRGGAGAAERVAHVGDVEDRCAVATKFQRNLASQKFLRPRGLDGGLREACLAIDAFGFRGGYRRDACRALQEGGSIVKGLFADLIRGV